MGAEAHGKMKKVRRGVHGFVIDEGVSFDGRICFDGCVVSRQRL